MDWENLPEATAADLRSGVAVVLLMPKREAKKVSLSVLREWLKDSDTTPGPGLGSIE